MARFCVVRAVDSNGDTVIAETPFQQKWNWSVPEGENVIYKFIVEPAAIGEKSFLFSESVFIDNISLSVVYENNAQQPSFKSSMRFYYPPEHSEHPAVIDGVSTFSGNVYTFTFHVGLYSNAFQFSIDLNDSDLTYEGVSFAGLTCDISGSGPEDISLQYSSSTSFVPETDPPFVTPSVTAPDFSAVTESPSPVDGWLQPAHGGVGGAIDNASAHLSDSEFIAASIWVDKVVTFLVTQPLISVFFALGCGFLITRVAFGGK